MKIAAVVVTYNRIEMLKTCIEKLLGQSCEDFDILIVDNASTDGTGEWAEALDNSRVRYRNTGDNIGGAGGFNYGIKWAAEEDYSHVWIMDDDAFPEYDALSELIKADKKLSGNYGFLSSMVLWKDGAVCRMNRQKLMNGKKLEDYIDRKGIIKIKQATFVSLFIPIEVIRKEGLPIKEYFIWGDDLEFTRRLTVRKGYPCYAVTTSKVIHWMKSNEGSSLAKDDVERVDRYFYSFRNENHLYGQEGFKGKMHYIARCGMNFVRVVFQADSHKFKRLKVMFKGISEGCKFRPEIEYPENR